MWFPNRFNTKRAVQTQKMAKDWKLWILKEEKMFYPCSENKGAFVFAYADCLFPREAAE